MPSLTVEFNLLPWYFGGDETLTYAEISEYMRAHEELLKSRQRQARELRRSRGRR